MPFVTMMAVISATAGVELQSGYTLEDTVSTLGYHRATAAANAATSLPRGVV